MLFFLAALCFSSEYTICFYDTNQSMCPTPSERYTPSQFTAFLENDYSNATLANVYIYADLSSKYFPLNKFPIATINMYGQNRRHSIVFEEQHITEFKNRISFYDLIVLARSSTKFNKVAFIRTAVNQINPSDSNIEIDPLVANDLIIDTTSLINVETVISPIIEIQFPNFATASQQTFYVIGDTSLKITNVLDGSMISFYGDSIIFNKDQNYIYINTAYWHGSTSIIQPSNTKVALQYLMANMTLKDKVINYVLASNSILALNECIWPTLDRVRLELTPSENTTIILSAINIPLFVKGTANKMSIITNSSSLFIPALNITDSNSIKVSSLLKTPTIFTIGTIYCLSSRNNMELTDPNTILITQILGVKQSIFQGIGSGQYSLFQYPPMIMTIHLSNLNTLYGSHTLVIPFSIEDILQRGSLEVDKLNGTLEIFPNIVGNPTIADIKHHEKTSIIVYSSKNPINNVTVNFNKRGLRGFTEGTNIYDYFSEYDQTDFKYQILIHQTRSIDQVNDKFCIALDESYCPSELLATFVQEGWQAYADHEIAEMSFYVYNTTDFILDFSKYDNPVVNFYGYDNSTVQVDGNSIEYNISYLVARNINFNITNGPKLTLGYSADLENVHFINQSLDFIDTDTYNFISDYVSFPNVKEELVVIGSQLAGFYDFGMSTITLGTETITLTIGSRTIKLPVDANIGTRYHFYFTEKSENKEVTIIKDSNANISYTVDISALPNSAKFKLINFGNQNYTNPIIKFLTFGSEITLDGEHPPVSFYDLIDGAVIRFNNEKTYMDHSFDASANVTLTSTDSLKKQATVVFKNVILPSHLIWVTKNVYVTIQDSYAVGGPSTFSQLHIDGNLTFNKGPALSAKDLSTENNAQLYIPYSFNSMPQINFTSKEKVTFKSLVMEFVPPIDENVFIHRNFKLYEDSMFDVLCGNFNCDSVEMVYISEIKYFNGDLCAFEKKCVKDPIHGQCLRMWFNSEKDPPDDSAKNKKKTKMTNVIIGVICGVVVLAIIVVLIIFIYKRKQEMPESLTANLMVADSK